MKVSSLLVVALCSTLFLGLFAFSGVPSSNSESAVVRGDLGNVRSAPAGRSTPPAASSLPAFSSAPLSLSALTETSGERGHFVTSGDVGPNGTQGFHFYSPILRQAGFDVNKSYFLYEGADDEGMFLAFEYLNTLGIKDIIGRRPRDASVTHIIGDDSQEWTTTADTWGAVRYRDLWAGGIDLRYVAVVGVGLINGFKSDFILTESSADPADIAVHVSGAESLVVSADGQELSIVTALGNVTQEVYMYDMITEDPVAGNFTVDGLIFGFEVDPEASWTKLVIDPLIYSTFLGGTLDDIAYDVWVDSDTGDAYVVGQTHSGNFPTTPGAYNTTANGNADCFVTKLAANGSALIYSTFVGGSGDDQAAAVVVDDQGRAYVAVTHVSLDFPNTPGAFDVENDIPEQGNLAVFRLSANGSVLEWSGVASGTDWEVVYTICLDPIYGDVLIAGFTESADFPVTAGAYDTTFSGTSDAFIARIAGAGTAWLNCTYWGGTGREAFGGVVVNSTGHVYFAGQCENGDTPTTAGAYDTSYGGAGDIVYGIMSWDLTTLHVGGYIGGNLRDDFGQLAMVGDDRVVVAGFSAGSYPTTSGVFNESHSGGYDIVISVFSKRFDHLNYSTYVGGSASEEPMRSNSFATDDNGHVFMTGWTLSTDFPIYSTGIQDTNGGGRDVYFAALLPDLSNITYSTYLGGTSNDYGRCVAVLEVPGDAWTRDVVVAGSAGGSDFPVSAGAYDESFGGGNDAFVARLYHPLPQPLVSNVTCDAAVELGANWTVYAKVTSVDNVSSVKLHFNDTYYDMSNESLVYYNYTFTFVTMNPGANTFSIWASGSPGNTTETTDFSFSVGDVPQFSDYSATSTVAAAVLWSVSLTVTDAAAGDSGIASVWFRFEGHADGWVAMTGDGDTYTSPSYAFNDEGDQIWQVYAVDNVGNVGYSTQNTLTVGGGASIASTSSTLTVTVAPDPWVPTEVSSWAWWIYLLVFTLLVLAFALTAAPRVHNGELFMSLLVAVGAGGMLAAYLSAVPGVLPLEMIGLVWAGLLAWAWATSRGGPVGLVAGGAVLMGYLAVQLYLADLCVSWLLGAYVAGAAAAGTSVAAAETGNVYVVVVAVILGILGVVFGVLSVFA